MRAAFLVFSANALLWLIQSQLNHYIAPWNLTVFIGGLCVAFASLRLSPRDGARALILTGFWFDAATPVPFGLHAFLFLLAHTIILPLRSRIAREEALVGLLIAVIVNLGMMIGISVALLHLNPAPLAMWPRLIADSLISFCVIVLIGPWAFSFKERLLQISGASLRRDARGSGMI